MAKRPSKVKNYMEMAETVAKRSHDAETKVGAILVNNKSGAIIATGYNGFIRGANDILLPNKRPDKYEYILHAEQNLIANCARHGISMEDCTLICTLTPCKLCMRMMFNCGITNVIAKEQYKDFDEILKMQDIKIGVEKDKEGFTVLKYVPKVD
jgi:dCMP deaminase